VKEVVVVGRSIGLDVHRDFCEVAIAEDGKISRGGRIETRTEAIALFARSLGPDDGLPWLSRASSPSCAGTC
jgi:hypothetical protein